MDEVAQIETPRTGAEIFGPIRPISKLNFPCIKVWYENKLPTKTTKKLESSHENQKISEQLGPSGRLNPDASEPWFVYGHRSRNLNKARGIVLT